MSRLSRRALRAIFFKMKFKGQTPKPKAPATLEDLAKAYKLPKMRALKPNKSAPTPRAPKRPRRIKSKEQQPVPSSKQELVIKIETPQAAKPKRKGGKKQRKSRQEAPKLEGAAKESEKKTRRERFVEGSETVSAGETYATAASGLFGFLKKRKQTIKAGAKKVGVVGAEGAVAGGAGTAVYRLTTEEEKEKKKRKKKASS